MAQSEVQICNNALIKLGADTITSLSDDTKAARLCNKMYSIVRDDLLRSHLWNFAIEREALAQLSTNPDFGYTYQYQLPSDCLRVLRIKDSRAEYRIEGRKLLTDENTVNLIFIKRVTDTSQFDASFADLLALKLAVEIGYAITNSGSIVQGLNDLFERRYRRAKMIDAQEDSGYSLLTDTYLDSRVGLMPDSSIIFEAGTD